MVEAKFIVKGGGYLISPEQTCNVQSRVETMDICPHPNPFVLSVVSEIRNVLRFCFSFIIPNGS